MPNKNIRRGPAAGGAPSDFTNRSTANDIYVDGSTGILTLGTGTSGTSSKQIIDASTSQTLTNKTLTSPVINGASGAGAVVTLAGVLTENGAATSYTLTFPIPAGAILHNVRVIPQVLWNGTSASLKVGDTADDDGYFVGVDLKATDLLVGEVLSAEDGDLWGGKNGAYLVAASGRRGPTSSNFGQYYLAGSNITAIVTPGAADGSAGRTVVEVEYSIPTAVAQVAV